MLEKNYAIYIKKDKSILIQIFLLLDFYKYKWIDQRNLFTYVPDNCQVLFIRHNDKEIAYSNSKNDLNYSSNYETITATSFLNKYKDIL